MRKKLVKILEYYKLHGIELRGFGGAIVEFIVKYPTTEMGIQKAIGEFIDSNEIYAVSTKKYKGSALSNDINLSRAQRRKAGRNLKKMLKANNDLFDISVSEAAERVVIFVKELGWDFTEMDDKTANETIDLILKGLNGVLKEDVLTIGMQLHVQELCVKNTKFKNLYEQRKGDKLENASQDPKKAREDFIEAYFKLVKYIEVMADMYEGNENFDRLIDELNELITSYNAIAHRRDTIRDKNKAEEDEDFKEDDDLPIDLDDEDIDPDTED